MRRAGTVKRARPSAGPALRARTTMLPAHAAWLGQCDTQHHRPIPACHHGPVAVDEPRPDTGRRAAVDGALEGTSGGAGGASAVTVSGGETAATPEASVTCRRTL